MNYFELYQIPVTLYPDQGVVKAKFFELSKKFHPDFNANRSDSEQMEALEMSTENTNAFNTLKDQNKTVEYILKENGLLENIEKTTLPQDFLMEMMEINETLMELEFDFDAETFEKIKTEFNNVNDTLQRSLSDIGKQIESDPENELALLSLKDYYLKNKYLLRIKETLNKFAPPN